MNTMNVDVYLPPGYNTSTKYPVLYLLHGKDGNENSWMNGFWGFNGIHIDHEASKLISNKELRPLIIVSPEIDNSYGINTCVNTHKDHGYDRGMYENYVVQDLVSYVDTHYNVIANRDGRYIGGFSMGGFAALHDAFMHQDVYSKVAVMSAALWIGDPPPVLKWIYSSAALQKLRDPIAIAEDISIKTPVAIIEGNRDPFVDADRFLYKTLRANGVKVEFHEYPGAHDYSFWRSHVDDMLTYFDRTK